MAQAAAQSRMTTVGILSLSRALAMERPVSSGLPSVSTTLKVMPCTFKLSVTENLCPSSSGAWGDRPEQSSSGQSLLGQRRPQF